MAMFHANAADGPSWYGLTCQMPGNVLMQIIAYSGVSPFCKSWVSAFKAVAADPQQQAMWFASHHPRCEVLEACPGDNSTLFVALVRAAGYGSTGAVQVLLDCHADIYAETTAVDAALGMAASRGRLETVRLLLDRGTDVHAHGRAAFMMAARNGRVAVVQLLLNSGITAEECNRALAAQAREGHVRAVCLLLDLGADVHAGESPAGLNTARHDDALYDAASCGHEGLVQVLLNRGANPLSAQGSRALQRAADRGHTGVVRALLARGADVHAEEDRPLRLAASEGHLEVVRCLLGAGADVHAADGSALTLAVIHGNIEVVRMLLEHRAVLTPQHVNFASAQGHDDVVALLRAHTTSG